MEDLKTFDLWQHPQFDEQFLHEPSKVVEVMRFLEDMQNSNKMEDTSRKRDGPTKDITAGVTNTSFLVLKRGMGLSGKKSSRWNKSKIQVRVNMNQITFMQQIDCTETERLLAKEQRQRSANCFRCLGNLEYRRGNLDKSIYFYSLGMQYIRDAPILYVNRAACFLKKREYKRVILDCDFVLNRLDGRNLRAWLYRAASFKRLQNDRIFEESVHNARIYNNDSLEYIDYFLDKMRTDL